MYGQKTPLSLASLSRGSDLKEALYTVDLYSKHLNRDYVFSSFMLIVLCFKRSFLFSVVV